MNALKTQLIFFLGLPTLLLFSFVMYQIYGVDHTYPSQKSIAEMNQVFAENKAQWQEQVANTPRDGTNPKFLVLKEMPFDVPETWAFVYDESDEIAIRRGLHLPFWKTRVSQYGDFSTTAIGHILAWNLEGHFYWIIKDSADNGYALERHGSDYKVVQRNCSTFIEPITSVCPDQWRDTPSGEVEAVYETFLNRPPTQ